MFADFLWLMGAKQQYDRQKELGLAGLMGLLLTLFIAWKWDSWFYPIFYKLGFIGFAERVGLLHEMPIMVVLKVATVIFVLSLYIGLGLFLIMASGLTLLAFGQTKLGSKVMTVGAIILFSPVWIPYAIYSSIRHPRKYFPMETVYKRDKALRPLLKEYSYFGESSRMYHLYLEQLKRTNTGRSENLSYSEAVCTLNKVVNPKVTENDWVFGYSTGADKWYILFQNPLPEFTSESAKIEHATKVRELYNYPLNYSGYSFVRSRNHESKGFYANAIAVDFVWKRNEITVELVEGAQVELKNVKQLTTYHKIKSDVVQKLFNTIADRYDYKKAMLHSHLAFYIIPIAYRGDVPFSADEDYNKMAASIPNAEEYRPMYMKEIRKRLERYAISGNQWAIDYLNNSTLNDSHL